MPFFSIIIPIYNVEKYLNQCIESVLCQNENDYEIILVDDGSTDNCSQICDKYVEVNMRNIRCIHKKNGGLSDARNCGIKIAKGNYIIFLDGDDFWSEKKFLNIAKNFIIDEGEPNVILFQSKKLIEDIGKIIYDNKYEVSKINESNIHEIIKHLIETQSYSMSACTKILKRKLILNNKIFFEKNLLNEDLDWFLNLITNVKQIKALEINAYTYRIRKGSITTSIGIKNVEDIIYMLNKWDKNLNTLIHGPYCVYYKGILAYAYIAALVQYGKLTEKNRNKVKNSLKKLAPILKNHVNKRITITYYAWKYMGFELTVKLLKVYYYWYRKF